MESTAESKSVEATAVALYRHRKRTDWGIAMLLWEREGKRALQFEDGEVRIIAESYYGLLVGAENDPVAVQNLSGLAAKAGHDVSDQIPKLDPPTVADQIQLMLERYPGGFAGDPWRAAHRAGQGRRLKRHREPAIDEARVALSLEEIDALMAADNHPEVVRRFLDIPMSTDLVSKSHIEPARVAIPSLSVARAIRDLLYGEGDVSIRFDAMRRALGIAGCKKIGWPLMTSTPALVCPDIHVCVRPSVFDEQSKAVAPNMGSAREATGDRYAQFLAMSKTVEDALIEHGQAPTDLLDVHDFAWVTLRPGERAALVEYQRVRLSDGPEHDGGAPATEGEAEGDDVETGAAV